MAVERCFERRDFCAEFAPGGAKFVLIDAERVEKGGKKLTTHYPTR